MKRLIVLLLCFVLLLSGCSKAKSPAETGKEAETSEESAENEEKKEPIGDPIIAMRRRLEDNHSFEFSMMCMNMAVNGISQTIVREYAQDGSFHFVSDIHQWDHIAEFDSNKSGEYYYRYEDEGFICYSKFDGGETHRTVMSDDDIQELNDSYQSALGRDAIFPDYLENFTDAGTDEETGCKIYTFTLPAEGIMSSQTMLANLVGTAFSLTGNTYNGEDINIKCTVLAEPDTRRPVSVTYDFSELKPYVLTDSAQSGEFAFDTDFMTMSYKFDFDLPETTEIPADFIG